MGDHPRKFSDPTQRHLTPSSTHGRGPQGFHQITGFLLEPLVRFGHESQLLVKASIFPLPNLFSLLQLLLISLERFLQGLDQFTDGLLPLGQLALSLRLQGGKRRAREVQKRLIILLQCLARQGLE